MFYQQKRLYATYGDQDRTKFRGNPTTEVSRLVQIVYGLMDRVLPNGLHDLLIISDRDLEFCKNVLYYTPKSIDPKRVYVPKSYTEYPDTVEGHNLYMQVRESALQLVDKREFQATLFHWKTYPTYELVRAEIMRRQAARITPEMRELTRIKNETMLVRQLATMNQHYAKFNEKDGYGRRLNNAKDKEVNEFTRMVTDMVKFIDEVDKDDLNQPLPAHNKLHKPYNHIDVDLYNLDRKHQNAKNLLDSRDVYGICAEYNLARYEERPYREWVSSLVPCPYSKLDLQKQVVKWYKKLEAAKKRKLPTYSDVKRAKWEQISLPIEEFDRLYPVTAFDRQIMRTRWEIAQELARKAKERELTRPRYAVDIYRLNYAAVRTYEHYLDRVRERTYALQDRVNAELGLNLSFASLYSPKWLYIPPQAYDPSYYPPSYLDMQQMVADYLDPKN